MAFADKKVVTPTAFPQFSSVKDEAAATGINMVVFGPPGVGKTTFAASIKAARPDEGVLIFDIDVGRESVRDIDLCYAEPPKLLAARAANESTDGIDKKLSWQELRDYLDTALALKGSSPYRTLIFDSLSSIYYELLIPKVVGSEVKKVEWPHYAEAQRLLTKFVRDAKSLCEYGINTIFTGHQKEENDGDITNIRLSLPQGVRNEILLAVNHVGYLTRARNSETRELHLSPPKRVDGPKLRQTQSGKQAPLLITDPNMGKLLEGLTR